LELNDGIISVQPASSNKGARIPRRRCDRSRLDRTACAISPLNPAPARRCGG